MNDPNTTNPAGRPTSSDTRGPAGEPSVAEIAALTARLREPSQAGPGADPIERAALLADRDAPLDPCPTVADDRDTTGPASGGSASGSSAWSEFYSDDEIAAIGDALTREDVVEASRRLRAHHARTRDANHPVGPRDQPDSAGAALDHQAPVGRSEPQVDDGWRLPVWMRESAERTREAVADGTAPPLRRDYPTEIAARGAALRDRLTDGGDIPGADEFDGVPEARPEEVTVSLAQAARRLVAAGHDPDQARRLVTDYVQDTSRRVGFPIGMWGLDQHDLTALHATASTRAPRPDRTQHPPQEDGEWTSTGPSRPGRDHVDPLGRARDAVAALPDPRSTASGVGRDDLTTAADWSDQRGADADTDLLDYQPDRGDGAAAGDWDGVDAGYDR